MPVVPNAYALRVLVDISELLNQNSKLPETLRKRISVIKVLDRNGPKMKRFLRKWESFFTMWRKMRGKCDLSKKFVLQIVQLYDNKLKG